MSRVLVTGGAGFIGSHVVDELLDGGIEVRVLDVLHDGAHDGPPPYLRPDAEYVFGDIRDLELVERCLRGVDGVSHQASMVGLGVDLGDLPAYVSHNDLGTATLLSAMHAVGFAGRLVLASSMVVYGEGRYRCDRHGIVRPGPRRAEDLCAGRFEPVCPGCGGALRSEHVPEDAPLDPRNVYAATKLHQEHLCGVFTRETATPTTALRYHNVYGPRMPRETPYAGVASIFRSALEAGRPPRVFEDGDQRRDFVHVRDVARANALALLVEPPVAGALNIASGEPHTVGEMARSLSEAFAETTPSPVVTGEYRMGDVRHIVASPERARNELGFEATVSFADGMREFSDARLRTPVRADGGGLGVSPSEPSVAAERAREAERAVMVAPMQQERAPLLAKPFYANGDPGPIITALAHVPELLEVASPFLRAALGASSIDLRTKELVIVRASAVLRCRYCSETHAAVALDAGLSLEEVRALCEAPAGEPPPAILTPAETALVAWVDAVALGPGRVPAAVGAELRRHVSDSEVVELTLLVGATVMLNRFCTALGLPTSSSSLERLEKAGYAVPWADGERVE